MDLDTTFLGSGGDEYEYFDTELIVLHDEIQEMNEHLRKFDFRSALKNDGYIYQRQSIVAIQRALEVV